MTRFSAILVLLAHAASARLNPSFGHFQLRPSPENMKNPAVIHPFLFAIFPVLFLFAHNIRLFDVRVVLVPMAATVCLASLSWLVLSFVLADKKKAGLIVSLLFLLFFSYESFFEVVRDSMVGVLGVYIFGTRAYVLLVLAMLFAVGAYFIIKTRRSLESATNIANVVAAALVAMSLTNIGACELRTWSGWQGGRGTGSTEMNPTRWEEVGALPNIYYIILDEYARADVLEKVYGYDNGEFLDYLRQKGFYVARASRSNYSQTILSLASSLNLTYLDDLVNQVGPNSDNLVPAIDMMRNNAVFRFVKHYDYKIVAFSSGYSPTEMTHADVYMAPQRDVLDEFQRALISATPVPFVVRQLGLYDENDLRRERILYTFDGLAEVSNLEAPLLVFAHIVAPHQPFLFGQHGEEIDPSSEPPWVDDGTRLRDQYLQHYASQLTFINNRVEGTVDGILSASDTQPVVVLQADTGPCPVTDVDAPEERFPILNAYYLPNHGNLPLYDGITPVNTFRMIFNYYFGMNYELLEDESYFSSKTRPYAFTNVTDRITCDVDEPHPE